MKAAPFEVQPMSYVAVIRVTVVLEPKYLLVRT